MQTHPKSKLHSEWNMISLKYYLYQIHIMIHTYINDSARETLTIPTN